MKKSYTHLAAVLLCLLSVSMMAQREPILNMYTDDEGNLYWPKSKPMYLFIADNPSGENSVKLNSKHSEKYVNPLYLDSEGPNYIRTRYAVDPKTKKVTNPKIEVLFKIYADGIAPSSTLALKNANNYTYEEKTYYSKNLRVRISAKDTYSGVNANYYAINSNKFSTYTSEVNIDREGDYDFKYYSTDNVGNAETLHTISFTVDLTSPQTYHNITGITKDSVISSSTKIYLSTEDKLSGVKNTYFKIDEGNFMPYDNKLIKLDKIENGEHSITYYSVDNVGNIEKEKDFSFYLDKTAPVMSSDILGDKFIVENKVYFSGRTKLKLTAIDNRAGVKDIMYSVNGSKYQKYNEPFYMPSIPGEHIVRFYAIDNVANLGVSDRDTYSKYEELHHNVSRVYVDLTGPSLSHSLRGKTFKVKDTIYINSKTELLLKGNDGESGLKNIKYSIDKQQQKYLYDEPITLSESGIHQIDYFGYDNVNNRNIGKACLVVDNEGPEIFNHFSIPFIRQQNNKNIYPASLQVYLGATDEMTGNDYILYSLDNEPEKKYTGVIQGFKSGKKYNLKVIAVDKLDNRKAKKIEFEIE